MTNRTAAPATYPFAAPKLWNMECFWLENNIPVCFLHNAEYRLIRMDIRIKAGSCYQGLPGIAQTTAKILQEGTVLHPNSSWAEAMDALGAIAEISPERDYVSFSFHFSKEKIEPVLELVMEMLTQALFPQEKLEVIRKQHKQQLGTQLEKNSFVAYRCFLSSLFDNHVYGQSLTLEDMDLWTTGLLRGFFNDCYTPESTRIFMAGNITDRVLSCLDKTIGQWGKRSFIAAEPGNVTVSHATRCHVRKEGSLQSSLCIGKVNIQRHHPDWMGLQLLNRVLGGYFGSRLMTEIRERSGLAYGISSHLLSYRHAGLFVIMADVNASRTEEALGKIRRELLHLIEEPIGKEELKLVKNYEFGSMLRNFDGIFSIMDRYIETDDSGMSVDFWKKYFESIPHFTAKELQLLAVRYLNPDSMTEVTAGEINTR